MKLWLVSQRHILSAIRVAMSLALALAASPAFTQSSPAQLELLQARIDAVARMLGDNPRYKGLSEYDRRQLAEFVAGNMLFVTLHELGHTVMTEFAIPVLGRIEDAADSYAVTRLIRLDTGFSDGALTQAGMGWFLAAKRDKQTGDPVPFYDEHGLDEQRGYQLVCLMIGSGQEKYQRLAEKTGLPQSRQKSCATDYNEAFRSWETVLKPHLRAPDQPATKIDVVYGEATGRLEMSAKALRYVGLLETVAERVGQIYVWPAPFSIEINSCGFPNARWVQDARKLLLCYELAADFADLYLDYGRDSPKTGMRKSE
jgi:hypothetical protein